MNEWMNEWEYDHFILYVVLLHRQVLLVDNSLVLNHIISRRSTVLKNKTFGTQRYTIVNHNSDESYRINYHNSIYNNHCSSNNINILNHPHVSRHTWLKCLNLLSLQLLQQQTIILIVRKQFLSLSKVRVKEIKPNLIISQ